MSRYSKTSTIDISKIKRKTTKTTTQKEDKELKNLLGNNYQRLYKLNPSDIYYLWENDLLNVEDPSLILKNTIDMIPDELKIHLNPVKQKTSFYKCIYCKSSNTKVFEISSSSTDEGSFEKVICSDCGKQSTTR
jgi:hypothetical protein